jgi:hypothetical protein
MRTCALGYEYEGRPTHEGMVSQLLSKMQQIRTCTHVHHTRSIPNSILIIHIYAYHMYAFMHVTVYVHNNDVDSYVIQQRTHTQMDKVAT